MMIYPSVVIARHVGGLCRLDHGPRRVSGQQVAALESYQTLLPLQSLHLAILPS
jgi:hypothetical protein